MNAINDIFSSSNPEFNENLGTIIDVTASRILKELKDSRKPVPAITYPSFLPTLDRNHPNVDRIVDGIHKTLNNVFPSAAGSYIPPDILRRIFEGVFIRLKLHPISDRDKNGRVQIFHPDPLLSEVFEEPSDAFGHHNRTAIAVEQELSKMQKELSDALSWRLRALEDYFKFRSQNPEKEAQNEAQKEANTRILQADIDIRIIREKIADLCRAIDMISPVYDAHKKVPHKHFARDDNSVLARAWRIFHPSRAEIKLSSYLPQWTKEEEPFLFYFSLRESDFEVDDRATSRICELYRRIYERKLLIYYFISTADTTGVPYQELKDIEFKITSLITEIEESRRFISSVN
jgi:hypothetical protein